MASAAKDASLGTEAVAASAEQLAGSLGEIGRQVSGSSRVTLHSVTEAERSDENGGRRRTGC